MSATALGSVAVKAAIERAGIQASDIEEAYLGNVVSYVQLSCADMLFGDGLAVLD